MHIKQASTLRIGLVLALGLCLCPAYAHADDAALVDEAAVEVKVTLPLSAPVDGALAQFLAATEGMTMQERYRAGRALGKDERKRLVAEYKALSDDEKQALKGAIPRDEPKGKVRKVELDRQLGVGTVQYDTGVPHTQVPGPGKTTIDVGNRFNDPFASPHTISKVTFQANGNFFSSVNVLRVYGPPNGTTAPILFDTQLTHTTLGAPVMFTLPTAVTGLTGSFMVGMIQTVSSVTTSGANPAVDINDGGQGFHGMHISPPGMLKGARGPVGTGFSGSPTVPPGVPFNAIIRATGNNLPVELMSFTVD